MTSPAAQPAGIAELIEPIARGLSRLHYGHEENWEGYRRDAEVVGALLRRQLAEAKAENKRLAARLSENNRWPDPLDSPQAEAIRAGKVDDTAIRDLFDRMERELKLHRERSAAQPQATGSPPPSPALDAAAVERARIALHKACLEEFGTSWGLAATVRFARAALSAEFTACGAGVPEGWRELLVDIRDNGLIYWEPQTSRGYVAKGQMLQRIDALLEATPSPPRPHPMPREGGSHDG